MQIVIDVPDKIYEMVMNTGTYGCYRFSSTKAIREGVPLPKGHGRLKDIDWIDDNCEIHHSDKDGSWCYAWWDIDNAPTIIEADKEKNKLLEGENINESNL